jgi:DNA invertase Pin-like site-specific DNA recombinase
MRPHPSPETVQLSLACLIDPPSRTRRRDDLARRQGVERMSAALLFLRGDHAPEKVAVMFGISKATVYRWTAWASSDENPEADAFRRLVALRD